MLAGGAGADTFVFWLDGTVDRVTDFDFTQDSFQLRDLQGGVLASNLNAVLTFDARTGQLTWDDDGPGPDKPLVFGMLDGAAKIIAANLVGGHPGEMFSYEVSGAYGLTKYTAPGSSTVSSTTHFDPQGNVTSFAQQMADGTSWKNWFDVGNLQPWQHTAAEYDSSGRLLLYEVVADDKSLVVYNFDPANTQPWDHYTDQFDAQNRLFDRIIVNDDGSSSEITWDVANTQPWDHEAKVWNAAGKLLSTTFYNADGSIFG